MKNLLFIAFFSLFFLAIKAQNNQPLTVEKIMRNPSWIGTSPTNIKWWANNKKIYFLWNPTAQKNDSTFEYDIDSKKIVPTSFQQYAIANAMNNGNWNSDYSLLTFQFNYDIYLYSTISNSIKAITNTDDLEDNPQFIQKNTKIVFEKNKNKYVWDIETGTFKQLINYINLPEPIISKANVQNTWLENQQSMFDVLVDRKKQKLDKINQTQSIKFKDTAIKIFIGDKIVQHNNINNAGNFIFYSLLTPLKTNTNTIVPNYVTENGYTTDINGRTKVGQGFGNSEYFLLDIEKGKNISIKLDSLDGLYDVPNYLIQKNNGSKKSEKKARNIQLYGSYWNNGGTKLVLDFRAIDNKDRWIVDYNIQANQIKIINKQHDDAWIGGPNLYDIFWVNDSTLVFKSEQSGYAHLYLYQFNTNQTKAITTGNFEIQQCLLSKDKKYFYYISNEEHPGKQHIYKINFDGSNKQKLTTKTGQYELYISPNENNIAYRYSYINEPWELYIQENKFNAKPIQVTNLAKSAEFKNIALQIPTIEIIKARDNENIYAKIFEPNIHNKNNAAVVFVHGAGYLQNVHFGWSSYFREFLFNNLLVQKGYTVIDIDYRASSGYGRNWRTGIYQFMGGKDLDDHQDAIKYIIKKYNLDSTKIGMYGGSYGGFITLMAMFTKPDLIKAGAALRPVTDWAHYNHGYTANILNVPYLDSMAFVKSSPIYFANGLKNHLLICHGMIDVNVHFQDVVRLTQRLIELGKDNWELAVYPLEDHGFVEPSSWTDEYKRILKLFDTHLLNKLNK